MENRTMVEIKNLKKTFPGWDHPVLNGVDITVKKGDVVVILGPSGSGKTTLLRCINFLGKADEGQMTIGDMSIEKFNITNYIYSHCYTYVYPF